MPRDINRENLLADRYQLVELVGKGAMGEVYRAKDVLLGRLTVAIKFISQALLNDKRRDRFEQEATICALLGEKSIHIVQVRDYGVDNRDVPFYAMEFLEGSSLSDIVKIQPLPLVRFVNFSRQICLGLQCAHQGILYEGEICPIVHRDIKPSNILIVQDPTLGELVKILDFGIAKLVQTNQSQTHSFQGTLAYCSPEQMEGKELDNRSDIYSLGVMMYEMLTGEMPILPEHNSFGGWHKAHRHSPPDPFQPSLNIPKKAEELILGCLAKSPQARPQTISEVLEELNALSLLVSNGGVPEPANSSSKTWRTPAPTEPNIKVPNHLSSVDVQLDNLCLKSTWPNSKPREKIVFPRMLATPLGETPTLWAMLDRVDIEQRTVCKRYNQFLFLMFPHPMVLWITALHSHARPTRWLPCYLDLKSGTGQQVARGLGETGMYRILLFATNAPQQCLHVLKARVATIQRQKLYDWASSSQSWQSYASPQMSKQLLRREFDNIKPKIQSKLDAISDSRSQVSEV
ncbi:serine/threonine protein kinase [Rubidibacter lacunae KORDI 51-2]|uniref:non-specific serine/threonine protein kinase n=1 Tax=Rubidibacter lacunae KORDI 51-2 TaxID=582515 RepID=U5DHX3_9CHRO|nr:serine/threonine-protein kinase [Rubidibacter lacunae]ERN41261.1 serine/threonine protein kinase [Rubidibacter lacunae KORDI 51-2]